MNNPLTPVLHRYTLLWVLLLCTVVGWILQVLAAKVGIVTGEGLAKSCTEKYDRKTNIFLWLMVELAIIGSDVQEVVGSAIGLNILFGLPLYAGCLITAFDTFTILALRLKGAKALEAFVCSLVLVMCVCFFVNMFEAEVDLVGVATGTVVPRVPGYGLTQAVGLFGAVVMPHNIFLHSSLVQSNRRPHRIHEGVKYNAIESAVSLLVSFLINLAVVACFSAAFFNKVWMRLIPLFCIISSFLILRHTTTPSLLQQLLFLAISN